MYDMRGVKWSAVLSHPDQGYVTTFCNHAHRIRDGKPIAHECEILPPEALRAEIDEDFERALEIMSNRKKRYMRRGVKA